MPVVKGELLCFRGFAMFFSLNPSSGLGTVLSAFEGLCLSFYHCLCAPEGF